MAKRINYGFEKNKKEAKRKQKRDAKLEKKHSRGEEVPAEGQAPTTIVDDAPTDASGPKATAQNG